MIVTETKLKGCFIIEPKIFHDNRGVFFESFQKEKLEKALEQPLHFVQDNQSISKRGVLRGLHFQEGRYAQAKLVQVIQGTVLDVIVDVRENSDTFGQHIKVKLSGNHKKSIFIPKGMAHGFLVLSEEAIFSYKCDNYYHWPSEQGIAYSDVSLNIDWEFPVEHIILSEKDALLPSFKELYP
ncbi:dTDP-4-dehydrorhamnose 3,5-epimerase [Maribacter sp.]